MATLRDLFGGGRTQTFMGLPAWDGGAAPAVILGADGCTPYESVGFYCAGGAEAIREASTAFAASHGNWNFDLDAPAFAGALPVDGGDLAVREGDGEGNRSLVRKAVADVLAAGAVPVLVGGDDSLPTPMLEAMAGGGPLTILQIDAHIDWRDEVEGERWGLSSTMRRASEMGHVERIVQVGQRSMGSARPEDVAAARAWGASLIPASAADPVGEALALIPAGARVVVCLDWDGLDPSAMPAVIARTAGGLGVREVLALLRGVQAKARIQAMTAMEFMEGRDLDGQGAAVAAQVLIAALGLIAQGPRAVG